jgi:hypothetical protein
MEMRLNIAQRLALPAASDGGDEPRLGMPQQETRELPTRVARRTDDRDLHRHRRILCGWPHIYATHTLF